METLFSTPYTIPDTALVTHADRNTWVIDFTARISDEETIQDNDVFIEETFPGHINPVDGFVLNVDIDMTGKFLYVFWDGSPLAFDHIYLLHSVATLNTTVVVDLLTIVRCVG